MREKVRSKGENEKRDGNVCGILEISSMIATVTYYPPLPFHLTSSQCTESDCLSRYSHVIHYYYCEYYSLCNSLCNSPRLHHPSTAPEIITSSAIACYFIVDDGSTSTEVMITIIIIETRMDVLLQ